MCICAYKACLIDYKKAFDCVVHEVMMTEDQGEMVVEGKYIEIVSQFVFLGCLITKD